MVETEARAAFDANWNAMLAATQTAATIQPGISSGRHLKKREKPVQTPPLEPTQQKLVDDPPPPVSTTRLVAGTVLFGVLLVVGVAITAVGVGVTLEDPFAIGVVAVGLVLTSLAVEGLYQTWRPLLPSTWPENLIVEGFKIP